MRFNTIFLYILTFMIAFSANANAQYPYLLEPDDEIADIEDNIITPVDDLVATDVVGEDGTIVNDEVDNESIAEPSQDLRNNDDAVVQQVRPIKKTRAQRKAERIRNKKRNKLRK